MPGIMGSRTGLILICADWLDGYAGRFDLIVSNPPYIRSGDIAALDREVSGHDPRGALDGGPDGLDAYRRIVRQAPVTASQRTGGWFWRSATDRRMRCRPFWVPKGLCLTAHCRPGAATSAGGCGACGPRYRSIGVARAGECR